MTKENEPNQTDEQLPDIGREAIGKRLFEIEKRAKGYAKIVTWKTLNDCERETYREIAEEINRSIGRALARNQGVLKSEGVCEWKYDGVAHMHKSTCCNAFSSSLSPAAMGFTYCPFCGHKIKEVK